MHLKYLLDPANAITAMGLAVSVLGLHLAIIGELELAVAAAIWVFFLDHVDGVVAHRTKNRDRGTAQVGRHLDSLTDFSGTCVLPAVVLIAVNDHSALSLITAVAVVLVGGLRVAYYEAFSAQGGCFIGIPAIFNAPVTAAVFLASPLIGPSAVGPLLNVTLVVMPPAGHGAPGGSRTRPRGRATQRAAGAPIFPGAQRSAVEGKIGGTADP